MCSSDLNRIGNSDGLFRYLCTTRTHSALLFKQNALALSGPSEFQNRKKQEQKQELICLHNSYLGLRILNCVMRVSSTKQEQQWQYPVAKIKLKTMT